MKTLMKTCIVLLVSMSSLAVSAQNLDFSCREDDYAFNGYDVTEYFNNQVVTGSKDNMVEYDSMKFFFRTAENMKKFKENPEKYLPKYKGWCASAMLEGVLYKPDYRRFKIQDGKLLFFKVRAFQNTRFEWDRNPELHMSLADEKFRTVAIID